MSWDFLSEDWFAALERVRAEVGEIPVPPELADLRVNLLVTGGPDGDCELYLTAGEIGRGRLQDARALVRVPWEIARRVLALGETQGLLQAVLSGDIGVEGDATALLALQAARPTPAHRLLAARVREITRA